VREDLLASPTAPSIDIAALLEDKVRSHLAEGQHFGFWSRVMVQPASLYLKAKASSFVVERIDVSRLNATARHPRLPSATLGGIAETDGRPVLLADLVPS
jgi:hypothetical protein